MKRASALLVLAVSLLAAPLSAGVEYYVDPVSGINTPTGGSQAAPWQTVAYAVTKIAALAPEAQAGLVLNLRANALYPTFSFPQTVHGTPAQPIVVQPYDGDRVVFDGGDPRFRQPGAWEPVPGHADEWRTTDPPFITTPGKRIAWGQMMDTRLRLITYSAIEDMRASNESYHRVPLSDPRPAFGPLVGDETHKMPFTYLGPGINYQFENPEKTLGRVHLRLSSTHINAPGIQDYVGGANPNTLALSIAHETALAGLVGAQNVVFKNLVFQNGGETTLQVTEKARNLTFDHCEVYGARFGVRISTLASELKFHDCTFDGGLAPWTSRSDIKSEYYYVGPPDCPADDTGNCINKLGAKTHDILVIHQASQSEYVRCTFRHAHDGIQVGGDDVEIRDSLFEDLNDEVFQLARFGNPVQIPTLANLRIHGNVLRQVLNPVSFALAPIGGPVYFYRNVIDQRVPTRGFRTLPPDAPAPWIWRYGADFKDTPTLPFHCYQNTFLASHDVDKSSYLSHLFYSDPSVGPTFRNNVYLALNVHRPLSRVPSDSVGAVSEGNVWYRYDVFPDPLSRKPLWVNGPGKYFTLEELRADFPEWESQSQYADPQLTNFTDEYFEFASFYPNTDVRPVADDPDVDRPAAGGGVFLPSDLPDDFPSGGAPDVGARPVGAPVMAVGVDAATLLPAPGVPVALAGADQTIVDVNGDGFERVALDGSGSSDPDGSIDTFVWSIGGRTIATTANPTLDLPEGDHYVRLVVTDNTGKVDSDAVRIRVLPVVPGENRLTCPGFEEGPCGWQLTGGATISKGPHSGLRAVLMKQNGSVQTLRQRVSISLGRYTVSGWLATQSLVSTRAALSYNVLDAGGAVLASKAFASKGGNSPYSYHEATVDPVKGAAFIEVVGVLGGTGSGGAFFDDLRVRDRNLLTNGRFELRSPGGQEIEAPGWVFVLGGTIVDDPADVRGGGHALALVPYGDQHIIRQAILHTSPSGYRVSGWVKTSGLGTAPTLKVNFFGASGQSLGTRVIAAVTSEGQYSYVSRTLLSTDIPAGAASLSVEIGLAEVAAGTAFFDDVMVEPLP